MEGSLTDLLYAAGISHEPTTDRAAKRQAFFGPADEYLGAYDEDEVRAIIRGRQSANFVAAFRAAWLNKCRRAA